MVSLPFFFNILIRIVVIIIIIKLLLEWLELVHMTGPELDYLVTFHTHTHNNTHTQWSRE